jgi:hypothetical protein
MRVSVCPAPWRSFLGQPLPPISVPQLGPLPPVGPISIPTSVPNLTDLASQAQQQMQAQVTNAQGQIQQLQGDAQAKWNASQTQLANSQRIAAGATAAEQLAANGYNPNDAGDNQKAIAALAGGLSLIPAVGPVLGGAVAILDVVAQGVASVLEAVGLISKPGCYVTGTWSPANVLAWYPRINVAPGSFASIAVPMLAQSTANSLNCKPAYPPAWVLTAAAQLWNSQVSGPPMQLWVPPMPDSAFLGIFTPPQNSSVQVNDLTPYAFQPASTVPEMYVWYGSGVTVNQGTLQPQGASSAGSKIASGAAIAAGAVTAGILATAVSEGTSLTSAAGSLYRATLGRLFRSAPKFAASEAAMKVQSLLFSRPQWSEGRAKAWARSHGFRSGKVDVTEHHIRLRQSAPGGKHVFRTKRFGNGISAVVAR